MSITSHHRLNWESKAGGFWQAEAGPFTLRLHQPTRTLLITLTDRPTVGDETDDTDSLLLLAEDAARNALIDGETAIDSGRPGFTAICIPEYDR